MKLIGRYEILGLLGKGAMGEVYRGRDESLERIVAIKVIRDVSAGAKAVERFQREARAAARLNHPNIITVYEFGDHEGCPFIAMEYLEGQDLGDILDAGIELAVDRQIDIVRQAATGLHFAHQKGIIHRDVKPANIAVLDDGTVKLMDFGIAKLGDSKITQTGSVMGTVRYMPPEQIQGMDLDGRADLFSLGVTFYEMLTKERAFDGDSMTNVIYNVLHVDPKPMHQLDGTPHEWLQSVVHLCLEKNRDNRWPDCRAFVEALERRRPVSREEVPAASATSGSGARRATVVAGDAGMEEATREHRVTRPVTGTAVSPRPAGSGRRFAILGASAALAVASAALAWVLLGGSERGELIEKAEAAREAARLVEAKELLLQAEQADGSPEELARARQDLAALVEPLRSSGEPMAAKALLDRVVALRGADRQTATQYRALGGELASLGLPKEGPPFVDALQQAVEAYESGLVGTYSPAGDYSLMSACFELGTALVERAEQGRLAPHLRESCYDLARKLFLFVDEHEPGFNAFERANHARLERARLAGVARRLEQFKDEVDALIAEAETLEADPATQLQAVGNYRAVLARVAENEELSEHVALESYRDLAQAAIARIEESVREARQRLGREAQTAALASEAAGLEEQSDLEGALALYEELLGIEPANPSALARAADLRARIARFESLERKVEEALAKRQVQAARRALDEALELSPTSPKLAALGARLQRLEEGAREASEGAAALGEAEELRRRGRAEEAERRYLEISSSTNDDSVRKRADEAVREIRTERQAAQIQPLVDRARNAERQGDLAGAIESWTRVERLSSAWPGVQGELSRLRALQSKQRATSDAQDRDAAERAAQQTRQAAAEAALEEARSALDRRDPEAALAALEGLDGGSELRSSAQAQVAERRKAEEGLKAGEAALAAGRFAETVREAEAAAAAWPPLRAAADRLSARASAAEQAARTATPDTGSGAPGADPRKEIEAVLAGYRAAVGAADLGALQRLWPSLSGRQLKGVRDSFGFAKSHEVDLRVVSLDLRGDTAVVVCDREDRLETRDGQRVDNRSRATFRLRKGAGGWLIEAIE